MQERAQVAEGWPKEAHAFVETFARFEGAMKRNKMVQNRPRAEASWFTLAEHLKEEFFCLRA